MVFDSVNKVAAITKTSSTKSISFAFGWKSYSSFFMLQQFLEPDHRLPQAIIALKEAHYHNETGNGLQTN